MNGPPGGPPAGAITTHVRIGIDLSREYILQRIVERIGIPVDGYRILNLHRIGIEAPAAVGGGVVCIVSP